MNNERAKKSYHMKSLVAFCLISIVLLAGNEAYAGTWSGSRLVKYIEFDNTSTLSKLTVTADDGSGTPEETYIYQYNCSQNLCYSNTSESAKMVEAILLMAMSTRTRVKFSWDFGGSPTFYFRTLTVMRQ